MTSFKPGRWNRYCRRCAARAGQLARVAVAGRVKAHEAQELVGAFPPPGGRPAQQAWGDDVFADQLVREQADLLDDVADPSP